MTKLERGIIPIIGKPGSGKTRLGREMKIQLLLEHDYDIQHISIGDRVRKIGTGALRSNYKNRVIAHLNQSPLELMDDEIIDGILHESFLGETDESDLLFVDGMPRRATQIDSLAELARSMERKAHGVIVTEATDEISLLRLLMRAPRDARNHVDTDSVARRMEIYDEHFPSIRLAYELDYPDISVESVNTTGHKTATTKLGLDVVRKMVGIDLDRK